LWPPIGRDPALPVSRRRCDHFAALAALTPRIDATSRTERPDNAADATRCRKSSK